MKIIMITTSLPPLPSGGAELQALKLGEELGRKGISVSFLTPGKGRIRGRSMMNGMPVHRLYSIFSWSFEFLSRLRKKRKIKTDRIEYDDQKEVTDEITGKVGWPTVVYYNIFYWHSLLFLWTRRSSFDIIHAHTMEWSAIVTARLGRILKKPVVIKESTMNGFQSLARFPSGKKMQAAVMHDAYFVAMTKTIHENLLHAGIRKEKIFEIPNGIVVGNEILPAQRDGNPSKVLFVGNLYQQPAKGIDILLYAWRLVHAQFPNAILQIVGDGFTPAYTDFTERLQISGAVSFLGKQHDLARYYGSADIFVLPSRREGMPNALMEAMLYGVPTIATDISGCRDLISNNVNGILVPPKDPVLLANGICWLLSNPDKAKVFGGKGRETIVRDFNMSAVADKYISLYAKLLKGETAGHA
jgi:glycosyltransferase involved in cell wall biosynthesis